MALLFQLTGLSQQTLSTCTLFSISCVDVNSDHIGTTTLLGGAVIRLPFKDASTSRFTLPFNF